MQKGEKRNNSKNKNGKRQKPQNEYSVGNIKKKFQDNMVDFMQGEEKYIFNKTPIVKEKMMSDKPKRKKNKDKKQFSEFIREEEDDQFDIMEKKTKKIKKKGLMDADEAEFELYDDNLESYFIQNENNFKQLKDVPQMKFSENTYILSRIQEKQNKQLVYNLHMNRRGFIDIENINQEVQRNDKQKLINEFKLGEFIITKVISSANDKVCSTLDINLLDQQNFELGMIISGIILNQEDYGYKVKITKDDSYSGFIKNDKQQINFINQKPQLFIAESVDNKNKIVYLSFNLKQQLQQQKQLQQLHIGSLVKAIIINKLENGVTVKFGKYIGFINNLNIDAKNSKENDHLIARITIIDYNAKLIYLSNLQHILELDQTLDKTNIKGKIVSQFKKIRVENNNYIISVDVEDQKNQIVILKKKQIDQDTEDEFKLTDKNKIINKNVKLTDYNFMENVFLGMCRQQDMNKKEKIQDYEVGSNINCRIKKIFKNDKNQQKIIVELEDSNLTGLLEENQQSDKGKIKTSLKEKQKIKMQIISIDSEKNRLFLTLRNQFMSQKKEEMLIEIEKCKEGKQYLGFIQKIDKQRGVIVRFYNQVNGMISLKEIESHNMKIEDFKLFKSIRVWVGKKDVNNNKITLSLSEKSANQVIKSNLHSIISNLSIQGNKENFECILINKTVVTNNSINYNNQVYQLISNVNEKQKGPVIILASDLATFDVNFINQQNIKSLSNLQINQFYFGYITKLINNFLAVVNIHQGIQGLVSLQTNQQLKVYSVVKFQLQSIDNKRNIFLAQQLLIQTNLIELFNQKTTDQYQIGMILKCKISIVKQYGLIMDIDNNYTGVVLNQNAIKDQDYQQNQEIICRILDIDIDKKLLDLQQVNSKEKNFECKNYLKNKLQKYKINNSSRYDCKVLLGKKDYCIVELINHNKIIGFIGLKNQQHDEILKNVKFTSIIMDSRLVLQVNESELNNERRKDSMIGLNENSKIETGELVIGKVTKVQSNNVFLQITKKVMARIHKVYQQNGKNYQIDEKVTLQILSVNQDIKGPIQWIECIDYQNADIQHHVLNYPFIQQNQFSNKIFKAHIKTVNVNSIQPIYLELNNNVKGYASAFNLNIQQVNNISSLFLKDSIVDVIILHQNNHNLFSMKIIDPNDYVSHNYTQKSQKVYKKGDKVIVKVIKEYSNNRKVQIDESIFAKVEDIEYDDIYVQEKKESINKFQFMRGIVIDIKNEQYILSTRESLINDYERMMEMSTKQYKKYEQIQIINGDVRNRIIKYGESGVQLNMLVMGIVQNNSNKGCFIKIGVNFTVRAQQSELENVEIKEGSLILGRVIEIKENGQIEVSNRSSIVINGLKGIDDFNVNMKVQGRVIGFKGYTAIIQLDNTRVIAYLNVEEIDDPQQIMAIQKLLKINQQVTGLIIKIHTQPKPRLQISIKSNLLATQSSNYQDQQSNPQAQYIQELINNIHHLNLSINQQSNIMEVEQIDNHNNNHQDKDQDQDDNYHQIDEDQEDNENQQKEDNKYDNDNNNDDDNDNNDDDEEEEELSNKDEEDNDEESDQSVQSLEQVEIQQKQKKKQKKEQEMIKKEMKIRMKEQQLLEKQVDLKEDSDYEKIILQNPNSSYFWINYIAFKMEKEGIEKARNLSERALRVVNYKNERDRLNIWNSYINLEFNFGTEQTLLTTFKKALENNNPKKIYLHLIDLYRQKGDQNMMTQLALNMVKKNKQSKKCWLEYMRIIIQNNCSEDYLKQELRRSLQSVQKNKHLQYLQIYARLLFSNQRVETGRSTMEAIITNYPKRTDLWSVYLDLEIKYGSSEQIRLLFDRSTSLTLKPKKMKFLFKRYLEYESQFGTTESIMKVKNKANSYVQSIIKNQNEVEEDQEDM